jgi:hypothetical protein
VEVDDESSLGHSTSDHFDYGLVAVLLVGVGVVATTAAASPTANAPERERSFASWKYLAGRGDDGQVHAHVDYDHRSVKSLIDYAAENDRLASQLVGAGSAEGIVTFRSPLAVAAFRTFATQVGLTAQTVDVRTRDRNGMRSTIALFPKGSDSTPQATLDRLRESGERVAGPLSVEGVVDVRGTIAMAALPRLINAPQVFLTDVTPTLVRQDLRASGVADADHAEVIVAPPFWFMEDLGISNFR